VTGINLEQSFVILLSKNCNKAVASVCGASELDRIEDVFRERRLPRDDQSLRVCLLQVLIRLRK